MTLITGFGRGRGAVGPMLAVLLALTLALAGCAAVPTAPTPPAVPTSTPPAVEPTAAPVVFAVIGDYGMGNANEQAVADLVRSWDPEYVITTGDDYYKPAGGTGSQKYVRSTGDYYADWLPGTDRQGNAFFPTLGNHDYTDASLDLYEAFFDLPGLGLTSTSGNERYYDFVKGPVHFFMLDSCEQEPDGTGADSKQAQWLKAQLAASTSRWNVVVDHHPPYSSDAKHGSTAYLQWPFAEWGADVVVSGHAHSYERIERDGIVYLVNGLGGAARYAFKDPVRGSRVRFSSEWGAQRVTVEPDALVFEFFDVDGRLRDTCRVAVPAQ